MSLTRRIARPLMAGMFVYGGLDAARHPETKVDKARQVVATMLPGADPEVLVRVNGLAQVAAGSLFALGKWPRLAALVLAGSLVPTTVAGHQFWTEDDPAAAANQRVHFLKNLSMLGGLLLAALDTEGRPSLGWRARRAATRVGHSLPSLPDSLPALPSRA